MRVKSRPRPSKSRSGGQEEGSRGYQLLTLVSLTTAPPVKGGWQRVEEAVTGSSLIIIV